MIAYIDMDVQLLLPLLELLPAKREALAAEIQDLRNRIQIRRQSQSQPGLAFWHNFIAYSRSVVRMLKAFV